MSEEENDVSVLHTISKRHQWRRRYRLCCDRTAQSNGWSTTACDVNASLNIWNLQHFMVLIKPSSPIHQEPVNPESIEAAVSILSRKSIPGVVMQRKLKNVPKQRCWMVGSPKGNNAMEMAIQFNSAWETDLRVGFHDCRHYTNELVQHLTGEVQIVERLTRSYSS